MTLMLAVSDLKVCYGAVEAVCGVSWRVTAGETLGIVGSSGCGKSTTVRAVVGLVRPSAGEIIFDGCPYHAMTADQRRTFRRRVQMVFQDAPGSLNPRMTVRAILTEALTVHRMATGRAGIEARCRELLEQTGLSDAALAQYPRELSGGQCQRVSLARALAVEPQVLLADEPVSALDVSVQARIINLLRDVQRRLGLALVLIAHDLAVVRNVCDRVCVMSDGLIVEEGSAAAVIDNPQHEQTRMLIAAVPRIDTLK
jgi:ABC-type glutathione transport system ATPase component